MDSGSIDWGSTPHESTKQSLQLSENQIKLKGLFFCFTDVSVPPDDSLPRPTGPLPARVMDCEGSGFRLTLYLIITLRDSLPDFHMYIPGAIPAHEP